jgi:hypothetical protein
MFYWFQKKKIVIDCFTTNPSAYNLYRIDHAIKYVPAWWKSMPARKTQPLGNLRIDLPTIKRCQGLLDQYQRGIILPLWSDIMIMTTPQSFTIQYADYLSKIKEHNKEQYAPAFRNYHHMQLVSPWSLKERTGIEFISMPCIWSILDLTNHIHGLPGHVNFKYQHGTHANVFMDKSPEKVFTLPAGTPLIQFIPLTESRIELRHHQITDAEFNLQFGLGNSQPKFTGNYSEKKRLLKQCPYTKD